MHSRPSLQLFRRDRKNCKHFHHYLRDGGSAYISLIVSAIATVGVTCVELTSLLATTSGYLQDLQVKLNMFTVAPRTKILATKKKPMPEKTAFASEATYISSSFLLANRTYQTNARNGCRNRGVQRPSHLVLTIPSNSHRRYEIRHILKFGNRDNTNRVVCLQLGGQLQQHGKWLGSVRKFKLWL